MASQSFLKASALGLGSAVSMGATPFVEAAGEPRCEGEPGRWVASACEGCTCFCPVSVYVEDGRAIRVNGNPDCAATHGQCCPKATLALQHVYDPDRIKAPMKRTNLEKGRGVDPGFVPITWDEALETIADKLLELREDGEPEKFMLVRGRGSAASDVLCRFFPALMGAPNYFGHSTICATAEKTASWAVNGMYSYRDYDMANCTFFLMWSTDPIASNRQQPAAMARWGQIMDGARIVVVDPRYSITAAKADKWLPIIPGTDGALACAIAHVILTTGKWNKEFVGDFKEMYEASVLLPDEGTEPHVYYIREFHKAW